jgi:hypothetical protein
MSTGRDDSDAGTFVNGRNGRDDRDVECLSIDGMKEFGQGQMRRC